jgi:hypothetical protein
MERVRRADVYHLDGGMPDELDRLVETLLGPELGGAGIRASGIWAENPD